MQGERELELYAESLLSGWKNRGVCRHPPCISDRDDVLLLGKKPGRMQGSVCACQIDELLLGEKTGAYAGASKATNCSSRLLSGGKTGAYAGHGRTQLPGRYCY